MRQVFFMRRALFPARGLRYNRYKEISHVQVETYGLPLFTRRHPHGSKGGGGMNRHEIAAYIPFVLDRRAAADAVHAYIGAQTSIVTTSTVQRTTILTAPFSSAPQRHMRAYATKGFPTTSHRQKATYRPTRMPATSCLAPSRRKPHGRRQRRDYRNILPPASRASYAKTTTLNQQKYIH